MEACDLENYILEECKVIKHDTVCKSRRKQCSTQPDVPKGQAATGLTSKGHVMLNSNNEGEPVQQINDTVNNEL